MIRAFFSAVVAALTLAWYDPLKSGKLTLFEVYYPQKPSLGRGKKAGGDGLCGGLAFSGVDVVWCFGFFSNV